MVVKTDETFKSILEMGLNLREERQSFLVSVSYCQSVT